MREILIAENAGYCFGVKRAMNIAWDELNKDDERKVFAYGPLIHNKQAVGKYEELGLITVDNIDDIEDENKIIIRSHGVGKSTYDQAKEKGLEIVDTTCPFVRKIHYIVSRALENGKDVIVMGNSDHPEVVGINGWCEERATVVKTLDDVKNIDFDKNRKYVFVSQTTMNLGEFERIEEYLNSLDIDVEIENTICSATKLRQNSATELASQVDLMVVIGGRHSSNTQKLVKICEDIVPTYSVETVDELKKQDFSEAKGYNKIGVTAGASTPGWIIDEVIDYLKSLD